MVRSRRHAASGLLFRRWPRLVEHHGDWPRLLRVVSWFLAPPRFGLYLRQLPVEGVDTKFFEQRACILHALLLHVHPDAVELAGKRFKECHGLRWEEPLVRFRFLDDALRSASGFLVADLAVPAPVFRELPLPPVSEERGNRLWPLDGLSRRELCFGNHLAERVGEIVLFHCLRLFHSRVKLSRSVNKAPGVVLTPEETLDGTNDHRSHRA